MSDMYDVIIIGSGLGGLECAYILSKEGYKVCVVEKNRQYGGCLQIFSRDKVIFDTGVHYIGGLDPGQNLYQYWNYFGLMDELKLKKMDEGGFDRISFGNSEKEYKHAMGYEGFAQELIVQFPEEASGIQKYIEEIKKVCDHFPLYNLRTSDEISFDMKYLSINTKDFIASCTDNVILQNVLGGSNALYAGYPDKTPLYVHALVINTYIESAYKCVDGGGQITRHFEKSLKQMGCTLMNYAEVKHLHVNGGSISELELQDGQKLSAKQYISNIHPSTTMHLLEGEKIRKAYKNRMTSLENSISVFTVHIVFKEDTFEYLNYNLYHHGDQDAWSSIYYDEAKWPESFALFVPAESKSEKYASGMNLMAYMNFSEVERWKDSFNTVPRHKSIRDQSYQDWKMEKCEKLIDLLETRMPGTKAKIKSYYASTPLSFRDYIGTTDGSLYGVRKDWNEPLKTYISPKTKVDNLFLTGQNLNMHGMLGVTVGSVVTCGQFMDGNELVKKIKAAN